ncbi:MAG: hypothetical protein H7Y02_07830 [Candidatus Obscuribacterales bacterium]|nr:hypothetical protein [Steroidobacteraceae bacterium]
MSGARPSALPGKTRVCPHCKAVILDSANICPSCQHHLRFGPSAERRPLRKFSALQVESTIRHSTAEAAWEYAVVLSIRNSQGHEIKRHVVDVGAMQPDEQRTFTLSVDVAVPE